MSQGMENHTKDDVFKAAEMRVAAYSDLSAEHGRALYAAYVKCKIEVSRLREEIACVLSQ